MTTQDTLIQEAEQHVHSGIPLSPPSYTSDWQRKNGELVESLIAALRSSTQEASALERVREWERERLPKIRPGDDFNYGYAAAQNAVAALLGETGETP